MAINAYFLGPKGENGDIFKKIINEEIDKHIEYRKNYNRDTSRLPDRNDAFRKQVESIKEMISEVTTKLQNSTPFSSPYYLGHMNGDVTLAGLISYFATTLFNPNNVAFQASPITAPIESEIGKLLCDMLCYDDSLSWGHITSCGTISNIEAMWVARNAKYLSYSMQKMIINEKTLWDIDIYVNYCGEERKLRDMKEWEVLNITLEHLSLGKKLRDLGVTKEELDILFGKYDIQHLGMSSMPKGHILVPANKHYSWDKGAALIGIGQANLLEVILDKHGRMDMDDLERCLKDCQCKNLPVILVVAVCGSTAEGAVDDLEKLFEIRDNMRKSGMDFFVHIDAAWGGYFCAAMPRESLKAPKICLSPYVLNQLKKIREADSVTIDPHKSGYIQYSAGALCYKNTNCKDLITFSDNRRRLR